MLSTLPEDRSIGTDYHRHRSYLSPSKCPPRATLIGIPRELRDVIYEHLANTHAKPTGNSPLDLDSLPSGTRKYTHGAYSLLRANRTLRAEVREHIRQYDTFCVSQRYRAPTGLASMTLRKHAPIPTSARKLYLRIYIALPRNLAQKVAEDSMLAGMSLNGPSPSFQDLAEQLDDFAVLRAALRDACWLEELVLELAVSEQGMVFDQGRKSSILNEAFQTVAELGVAAMEREVQKLPRLRRCATVVEGLESNFMRRTIGQQWTRQCLIPSCVPMCHCYGAFGSTCVEDSRDLLASLTPCAAGDWIGFCPDGDFELGHSAQFYTC